MKRKSSNCIPTASQLHHAIGYAYGQVQFLKNVHRGPGEPRTREFRVRRKVLMQLKRRLEKCA